MIGPDISGEYSDFDAHLDTSLSENAMRAPESSSSACEQSSSPEDADAQDLFLSSNTLSTSKPPSPRSPQQREFHLEPISCPYQFGDRVREIADNRQLSAEYRAETILQILCACDSQSLDAPNVAVAFHRLGKLTKNSRDETLISTLVEADSRYRAAWEWLVERAEECLAGNALSTNSYVNLLWGVARSRMPLETLYTSLAQAGMNQLGKMEPWQVSISALSFAHLRVENPYLWETLYGAALMNGGRMDAQGLANTTWAFATAGQPEQQVFHQFAQHALYRMPEFEGRTLTMMLWAYVTAGATHQGFVDAVAERVATEHVPRLGPHETAFVAWGLARLGGTNEAAFMALANQAVKVADGATPREMSLMVWALANRGIVHSECCEHYGRRIKAILKGEALVSPSDMLSPSELSNVAWGLAVSGHHDAELFSLLGEYGASVFEEMNVRHMAVLSWAISRVEGASSEQFFQRVSSTLVQGQGTTPTLGIQDINQLAQAFVSVEFDTGDFYEWLSKQIVAQQRSFSIPELLQLFQHCASSDLRDASLAETIGGRLRGALTEENSDSASHFVATLASAGLRAHSVFEAVTMKLAQAPEHFSDRSLGKIVWAATIVGVTDEKFWNYSCNEVERRFPQMPARVAAGVLWSLSVRNPELVRELFESRPVWSECASGEEATLMQLHQALVAAGIRDSGDYPEEIKALVDRYREQVKSEDMNVFETEVYEALQKITALRGASITAHEVIDGIEVDFLVEVSAGRKWVVEADGKFHYLKGNYVERRRGGDQIQDAVFRRSGCTPLHIDEREWRELPVEDRASFLEELFAES